MLKIVYRLENGALKKVLRRLRLYHPPLQCLIELSEGSAETLITRGKEFSEVLEDILINGVWKRTGFGRLSDLDNWVVSNLSDPLPNIFRILEVGGSDGSTTYDTVCYFRENLRVDVKANILERHLRLHCFSRGFLRYYLTYDGSPLLLQIGLLGILLEEIKAKEGIIFNPIVRVTRKFLKRHSFEKYLQDTGDLIFINPLIRNRSDIVWLKGDLFQFEPSLVGTFDFIRCSNVLNCGYFSEREIYDAVRILVLYLKPKGLLLVSRTKEKSTGYSQTASLWMKIGSNLQLLSDLNGGSEVKNLVQ